MGGDGQWPPWYKRVSCGLGPNGVVAGACSCPVTAADGQQVIKARCMMYKLSWKAVVAGPHARGGSDFYEGQTLLLQEPVVAP
jgi:hypothetical protein